MLGLSMVKAEVLLRYEQICDLSNKSGLIFLGVLKIELTEHLGRIWFFISCFVSQECLLARTRYQGPVMAEMLTFRLIN